MELKKQTKGYILIGIAATLWGTMSLMIQYLLDFGISSKDIVPWKLFIGFITMCGYVITKDKSLFKVDKKGFCCIALMGFICQTLFSIFLFGAYEKTTIATATALLYTAPIFVMIMSRIFYKESFSIVKIGALILCILGCFLAVTEGNIQTLSFDFTGILLGLGSGLTYATMTILSKALLKKYNQLTIVTYMLGFGCIFSFPFSNPFAILNIDFSLKIWLDLFVLGLGPTALSYIFYTTGLLYGAEASKASIISTLEIVVAVFGAYIIYGQNIVGWKLVGIIMILSAVVLVQGNKLNCFNKRNKDYI